MSELERKGVLPPITPESKMVLKDAGDEHALSAQAEKFGGPTQDTRANFTSMIKYQQDTADGEDPAKPKQASVPVFLTLVVKNLMTEEGGGDDAPVFLNGTLIHRSLFLDTLRVSPIDTDDIQKTFKMRLNEGPIIDDECLSVRKCVPTPISMTDGGEVKLSTYEARCTTSSFKMPMRKLTVFNMMPFQIVACEVYLELTSFVGEVLGEEGVGKCETLRELLTKLGVPVPPALVTEDIKLSLLTPRHDALLDRWLEKMGVGSIADRIKVIGAIRGVGKDRSKPFELRPDLMCHTLDPRNIVSVRSIKELDGMQNYDVINPNPTVEFVLDSKRKKDKILTVYVPKVRLTWYCERDYFQSFMNIVMPVLFITVGTIGNSLMISGWQNADYEWQPDYLANAFGLGLTLVFLIPSISDSTSIRNEFTTNHSLIVVLFMGIILSTIGIHGQMRFGDDIDLTKFQCFRFVNILSWVLLTGGLIMTPYNFRRFRTLRRKIENAKSHEKSDHTFIGRPGEGNVTNSTDTGKNKRGSDVNVSDICPVWTIHDDKQVVVRDDVMRMGIWKTEDDENGDIASVYSGLRRKDLGEKNKWSDIL